MSRVARILLILIENVMASLFYTTTWIDVELRTHCNIKGYQDSNYHWTGSDDLLIGDPFTPAIWPAIFSFTCDNFLRRGGRERGGGREGGRREEPEAFGCVAIIIHNNKSLMLCSILWLMISLIYSQKSPLYILLETTDPFLPLKTMWSPKFLFLPRTNPRHI